MAIRNAETSGYFEIQNIHVGKSIPTITFSRFLDKEKTQPENFPDGVYTMEIFNDPIYTDLVRTIEQSWRLILDDNKILFTLTAEENDFEVSTKYFRVLCTSGADIIQVLHGTLNFIY